MSTNSNLSLTEYTEEYRGFYLDNRASLKQSSNNYFPL